MSTIYKKWAASESRRKLKLKAIKYLGGKCIKCGYNKCVDALDFHHRSPIDKDFSISGSVRKWEIIKAELDKCDLLCSNCHREEHSRLKNIRINTQKELVRKKTPERKLAIESECIICNLPFKVQPHRIKTNKTCSKKCLSKSREKIEWPENDDLKELVETISLKELSNILNVSSAAIKKRIKKI